MMKESELRHLLSGVHSDECPNGLGTVRFSALCPGNASDVLHRSKEILQLILEQSIEEEWKTTSEWKAILPSWFVEECNPEMTQEEQQQWLEGWRKLTPDEQRRVELEAKWSLEDWLYWMQPDHRKWFWWDGVVINDNLLYIAVEVEDYPFAWDALAWLLRASGSVSMESVD
jgi:hypothetical protein